MEEEKDRNRTSSKEIPCSVVDFASFSSARAMRARRAISLFVIIFGLKKNFVLVGRRENVSSSTYKEKVANR